MKLVILFSMLLTLVIKSHGQERITSNDIEQVISEQNQTHKVIISKLKIKKEVK